MSDTSGVSRRIDLTNAMEDLNNFTQHFCQNKESSDLEFYCSECPFCTNDNYCLVKRFGIQYKGKHDFDMSKFGSTI